MRVSRRPVQRASEADENTTSRFRPSLLTINTVIEALKLGTSERGIAITMRITESEVRFIRQNELARIDRALASVRLGMSNTVDLVNSQQREYWDEIIETGRKAA